MWRCTAVTDYVTVAARVRVMGKPVDKAVNL